jgi:hypothetical protein
MSGILARGLNAGITILFRDENDRNLPAGGDYRIIQQIAVVWIMALSYSGRLHPVKLD